MDQLTQFLPLVIIAAGFLLYARYHYKKSPTMVSNSPEKVSNASETDNTFEDKMLILQAESNKRLKGIGYTLEWFFWIMILGIVFFSVSFFISLMNGLKYL